MPANTATRSQRRLQRHIADPHLSGSPNRTSLPEPDRDTQQNITRHRTYPQHGALAARHTRDFPAQVFEMLTIAFDNPVFRAASARLLWASGPNPKGPTPGAHDGSVVAKTLFVFAT
jgi:hypothetical protein